MQSITKYILKSCALLALCLTSHNAFSVVAIPNQLEFRTFTDITTSYQTKTYETAYASAPVIVCTYNLTSNLDTAAQVRIKDVTTSGFNIRLQTPTSNASINSKTVHCIISKAGKFTDPIPYVAGKIDITNTQQSTNAGWTDLDDTKISSVDGIGNNTYLTDANLTVLGQVTSVSDENRFLSFWSHECGQSYRTNPTKDNLCIGKHRGKTRLPAGEVNKEEEISYIVAPAGTYELPYTGNVNIGNTANNDETGRYVKGVSNLAAKATTSTYTATLDTDNNPYTFGIATQAGMNGSDGGWSVLYGSAPVNTKLSLAIDETGSDGNATTTWPNGKRTHIEEEVHFWAFRPNITPKLNLKKTVDVQSDPINGTTKPKAIANSVLRYTIQASNEYIAAPDTNSLVITDSINDTLRLYVGTSSNTQTIAFADGDEQGNHPSGLNSFSYGGPSSGSDHVDFSASTTGNNPSDWEHEPKDTDNDGFEDTALTRRIRFRLPGQLGPAIRTPGSIPETYSPTPTGRVQFSAKYTPN